MTTLYEMDEQMKTIEAILIANQDPETEEILENAKIALEQDIENKMESILKFKADCDAKIAAIKNEIARLQKKTKTLSNTSDFLKNLCYEHMMTAHRDTPVDYGTWTLSIAKTPAKVVLTDDADALLPDCYCTITREPNKTAIKNAMTDGELYVKIGEKKITLATLETGTTLRIK